MLMSEALLLLQVGADRLLPAGDTRKQRVSVQQHQILQEKVHQQSDLGRGEFDDLTVVGVCDGGVNRDLAAVAHVAAPRLPELRRRH